MAITFQIQDVAFKLEGRIKVKGWIRKVLRAEGRKEGDLNFLFTSDEKVHETNLQFLSHDTLTDIITFDQGDGNTIAGDIMISADRVRDNASTYGVSFEEELRRVMIHGVLHLCGYKDKTDEEKRIMRVKEDEALSVFSGMA